MVIIIIGDPKSSKISSIHQRFRVLGSCRIFRINLMTAL